MILINMLSGMSSALVYPLAPPGILPAYQFEPSNFALERPSIAIGGDKTNINDHVIRSWFTA